MIFYKISELSNDQQVNIRQDNYMYCDLKLCYQTLSLKLLPEGLVSKIIFKCDSQVELISLTLTLKKEQVNDLAWKQINIPYPQWQSKQGYGEVLLYQININENQQVSQIQLKLKDPSGMMRIYFLGITKGEKQLINNKVINHQGDIRNFFDNVSNGKSIQRNENGQSKSIEPYQNDYTNQQFGLRRNFSQLKSTTDIVDDFGHMSLEEKNMQRLALEKFQAEKNKKPNKPQDKQQPQRYEEKILITDKRDANFHINNKKPQKIDDFRSRDDYIFHMKQQSEQYGQPNEKQEQNNKQVQKELGYNDPQKQQQKRNQSKESNKSKPDSEEFDPYKGMDPMDTDFMIVFDWEDYTLEFQQLIEKKGIIKMFQNPHRRKIRQTIQIKNIEVKRCPELKTRRFERKERKRVLLKKKIKMINFSINKYPWATVFCGIVEASIMANKSDQLEMFLQNKNKFLTWIEQKTYQSLEILLRDKDLNTFYNNLDLEGASGLMKQFIYFKLQVNAPPVLNQEILKQLSAQFLIDIYYKSPNTSIAVQSSSNMNIQLQISYNNQNYSLTLLEKSQQFNNIQQDPFGQECTGCLKLLNIRDQQRSTICQHIYCGQCLKIYFKIGMQFKCRDFFCGKQLCREDFPLFQMSPVRFEQARKICLSCNQVNGELFANRCGHVYCKKCLSDKLFQPKGFQTQFCLDLACTELLDQHIINLFSKPKESCQICLTEKQNLIKNDCGHLFCRLCIRIKYQEQITIGLLPEIECPICSKPLNLKKLYEQQVPLINQPQSSIPVIINRNNRAMSDSQSVPQEQPAQQPQPSGRIFVERTNTRIHSRIQNPLARSLVREREQPAADQTPRRGLPQSYAFGIMRQPNLY